jgi:hypothetical protein
MNTIDRLIDLFWFNVCHPEGICGQQRHQLQTTDLNIKAQTKEILRPSRCAVLLRAMRAPLVILNLNTIRLQTIFPIHRQSADHPSVSVLTTTTWSGLPTVPRTDHVIYLVLKHLFVSDLLRTIVRLEIPVPDAGCPC